MHLTLHENILAFAAIGFALVLFTSTIGWANYCDCHKDEHRKKNYLTIVAEHVKLIGGLYIALLIVGYSIYTLVQYYNIK